MAFPRITFFCELETEALLALVNDDLIADLSAMKAYLSLGILDLGPERAAVVQRLNRAGVPVIAWLLLPREQGYWFNLYNAAQAAARYADFTAWTVEYGLQWAGIGLDIEPDLQDLTQLARSRLRVAAIIVRRLLDWRTLRKARAVYADLVAQMHADGYHVDSYQFPVIADERQMGSTLLQRAAGLVDLPGAAVDREVWMLYSSFVRPHGAGIIACYAPEAQSVGLGTTMAGMDAEFGDYPPLGWGELARDLRLAWSWCEDLHIYSLEGCVSQGYLERLKTFVWDAPILMPEESLTRVSAWRSALRSALWVAAHFRILMLTSMALYLTIKWGSRYLRKRWSSQ
ncbi:MAG: hypothetical protein AB1894_05060 [Chloroflexota bacterium]